MSAPIAVLALLWVWMASATGAGAQVLPPLAAASPAQAEAAVAAVPLPAPVDSLWWAKLVAGDVVADGRRLQAQVVARWPDGRPRRALLRWTGMPLEERVAPTADIDPAPRHTAGWEYAYRLVAASADSVPWKTALRRLPLAETQYEMYQLDLRHGERQLGVRLGLRRAGQVYWWQFVRADFVARGPVFDLLRAGGPIYNEISTVQADLFLVLYSNGVVEAYAHFCNHQREGAGTDTYGVPVLGFAAPDLADTTLVLDGSSDRLALGQAVLGLGPAREYASPAYPGSLQIGAGLAVWQPWADQQVWGELLVEDEGIPEHRIERGIGAGEHLLSAQRRAADHFWVARAGEEYLPAGLARTVRFFLSLGPAPPGVARYEAPAWWHALAGALPTGGFLPTFWWATPHALELAAAQYGEPHPQGGYPFEVGRSARDNDGTLGAALLLLGHAADRPGLCAQALAPAYWWADIAIDHVSFTVHEVPKYSWQWIVQPYHRWLELVHAYWETGDPYLLETARFTADAYYRFFWTNRPHRSVGRDALPVFDLLALWEATGETVYWQRAREILAEVRRSYAQTRDYWPGHQSGAGPNGVARQPDWEYIPMLLARLHAHLLRAGEGGLPQAEREEAGAFLRQASELAATRGGTGWVLHGTALSYGVLPVLAELYPDEAERWLAELNERNRRHGMPGTHDGGQPFTWASGALWLDCWAWGARWEQGELRTRPQRALLRADGAPRRATVATPEGLVLLEFDGSAVRQLPLAP